jgi:hypothetical protein
MCHHQPILQFIPHTNHKLITLPILTNHTTPISSPYHPLAFCGNVGSHIFPNSLNHAQVGHFSLRILLVLTVGHDHTPQPTPISLTHLQPPPKVLCPNYGHQFTSQKLVGHQCSCWISNLSNPNPCDHFGSIPSFIPTLLAST